GPAPGGLVDPLRGDKSLIVAPETAAAGALQPGERLRRLVAKDPFLFQDHGLRLTIAVGVVEAQKGLPGTPSDLLQVADYQLDQAKKRVREFLLPPEKALT